MKMHLFIYLVGVDPFVGKVDKFSLSQQTLMEMFTEGIENRGLVCGNTEEPKEIEKWKKLKFNHNAEVIEINWAYFYGLTGKINLQWLPSSVQKVALWENMLSGSLDLTALPPPIKELLLSTNKFTGSIDLRNLPGNLQELSVSLNNLSGTVDLEKLPNSLRRLKLDSNEFSGKFSLGNLPAGLQKLFLSNNKFTGETDFSKLPKGLRLFSVSYTQLEGNLVGGRGKDFRVRNSGVTMVEMSQ